MARVGRPPLYNNCLDLDAACELYFEECDERGEPYTVPGICYSLGFSHRNALDQLREEFSGTAKRAKLRIEHQRAMQLLDGKGNPAGKIFDLKNNFGWVDRQEVVGNSGIQVMIAVPGAGPEQVQVLDGGRLHLEGSSTDSAHDDDDS